LSTNLSPKIKNYFWRYIFFDITFFWKL